MKKQQQGAQFLPLYEQVRGFILDLLAAGEWKPGDMIPSEFELADRFGVSQGTVRKAVDSLASDHILVRRQGKGTFVANQNEGHAKFLFQCVESTDEERLPFVPELQVFESLKVDGDAARGLGLRNGTAAFRFIRRMLVAREPVMLVESWVPRQAFRGLTAEALTGYDGTLYGMYESEYGLKVIRVKERLAAIQANAAQAEQLGVAVGAPLLMVERTAYSYADRIVEWRRSCSNTAKCVYVNRMG